MAQSFSVFLDGEKIGTLRPSGKGKKAKSNMRKYARRVNAHLGKPRKKNIQMGFWVGRGKHRQFRPIRASSDYDPSRVGGGRSSKRRKKSRRR